MDTPTLGARLKQARLRAGLTQKDAADALGVTYQAISNYERDKCRVQAGILKQLCVLYHTTATELLQSSAWDEGKSVLFDSAATDAERMSLFDLWGVPEDRQGEYEQLRLRMGIACLRFSNDFCNVGKAVNKALGVLRKSRIAGRSRFLHPV